MQDDTAGTAAPVRDSRGQLLRDAVLFQGKLVVDGLRDLILCPVAILAAIADLIQHDTKQSRHFYEVVHFGRRTEHWIDLFSAAERAPDKPRPEMDMPTLDEIVERFEARIDTGNRGKKRV